MWNRDFIAVWPDGTRSDFSLNAYELHVGGTVPGHEDTVLDRFELSEPEGKDAMVVGYFRRRDT